MIPQAESSLLKVLAPLKKILRAVEPIPDLSPEDLIRTIGAEAPAIYTDFSGADISGRTAVLRFDLLLLAKNSRSLASAVQGDGKMLGLHTLIDLTLARVVDGIAGDFAWRAMRTVSAKSAAFLANGFFAASIQCQTQGELDDAIDLASLADFQTFHSDYDLPPFQGDAVHHEWLAEPPVHTAGVPPLSDQIDLPNQEI